MRLQEHYRQIPIDVVVGIEARGYFFAPAMAHALGAGFVPVSKPKKLPVPGEKRRVRPGVRNGSTRDPCGRHRARPEGSDHR